MNLSIKLDMDGVIADFIGGVFKIMKERKMIKDTVTKEMWTEFNAHGNLGITDFQWQTLFKEISYDSFFWSKLDKEPHFDELLKIVNYFDIDFEVITDAPSIYASHGKKVWLTKYGIYNNMYAEKHKYKYAKPNAVLIDDKPLNCDLFIKHGGKAILYAQPWNATYKGLAPRLSLDDKEKFSDTLQRYELTIL